MPQRSRRKRTPKDPKALASFIVNLATETREIVKVITEAREKGGVALGRRGGLKGGTARPSKRSPRKRRAIAKKAAHTRRSRKVRR